MLPAACFHLMPSWLSALFLKMHIDYLWNCCWSWSSMPHYTDEKASLIAQVCYLWCSHAAECFALCCEIILRCKDYCYCFWYPQLLAVFWLSSAGLKELIYSAIEQEEEEEQMNQVAISCEDDGGTQRNFVVFFAFACSTKQCLCLLLLLSPWVKASILEVIHLVRRAIRSSIRYYPHQLLLWCLALRINWNSSRSYCHAQ